MEERIRKPCDQVRESAYAIHKLHGTGHLEKVYENAPVHGLRNAGLNVKQQHPLKVYDEDGTEIGDYYADLITDDVLVIELKSCKTFAEEHKARPIGYLRSANIEHGLLIYFGSFKFQIQKFVLAKSNRPAAMPKYYPCCFLLRALRSFAANKK